MIVNSWYVTPVTLLTYYGKHKIIVTFQVIYNNFK